MTPRTRLFALSLALLCALSSISSAQTQKLGYIDAKQWCALELPMPVKDAKSFNVTIRRLYANAAELRGTAEDNNGYQMTDAQKPLFCRIAKLEAFKLAVAHFTALAKDMDISVKNGYKFDPYVEFYAGIVKENVCPEPTIAEEEAESLRREYLKVAAVYLKRPLNVETFSRKPTTSRQAAGATFAAVTAGITDSCNRTALLAESALLEKAVAVFIK